MHKLLGFFDFGTKSGIDVPLYVKVGFQNRNKLHNSANDNSKIHKSYDF